MPQFKTRKAKNLFSLQQFNLVFNEIIVTVFILKRRNYNNNILN